jgi:hypothetical protein
MLAAKKLGSRLNEGSDGWRNSIVFGPVEPALNVGPDRNNCQSRQESVIQIYCFIPFTGRVPGCDREPTRGQIPVGAFPIPN